MVFGIRGAYLGIQTRSTRFHLKNDSLAMCTAALTTGQTPESKVCIVMVRDWTETMDVVKEVFKSNNGSGGQHDGDRKWYCVDLLGDDVPSSPDVIAFTGFKNIGAAGSSRCQIG